MSLIIQVNVNDLGKYKTNLKLLQSNVNVGVPEACFKLMGQAQGVASANTHRISGRLAESWVVQRRGLTISLSNPVPYAGREFSRPGVKTRGRAPIGGPHNVLPKVVDLIQNNLESTVNKALFNGLPR